MWWEYLKRSEKYRIFCEIYPKAIGFARKKGGSHSSYEKAIKELYSAAVSLNRKEWMFNSLVENMEDNIDSFGDVFKNSFEDWWKTKSTSKGSLPYIVLNDQNALKMLPHFTKKCDSRKKSGERFPYPEEIIKLLTEEEFEYIFLAVPMVGRVTVEEISQEIAAIRTKWKDEFDVADYRFKRFTMPVSRVRFDELKRYLQIYDLKQEGMKMKDIVAKVDPSRKGNNADVLRAFRSDLQKAKKVIESVEYGCFPDMPIGS